METGERIHRTFPERECEKDAGCCFGRGHADSERCAGAGGNGERCI